MSTKHLYFTQLHFVLDMNDNNLKNKIQQQTHIQYKIAIPRQNLIVSMCLLIEINPKKVKVFDFPQALASTYKRVHNYLEFLSFLLHEM